VLEQSGLYLGRADDAIVGGEPARGEGAPVLRPGLAQRAKDAAVGVQDLAVRVAERPRVGR
jgi:hypothetical protein